MIANLFGPDLGYVVIIVLVVLVAGSQLPKIARNIGSAGKEFRRAHQEAEEEAQREQAAQAQPSPTPAAPADPSAVAPAPPAVAIPPAMPVARPAGAEAQPSLRPSAEFEALLNARDDEVHREATG